MRPRFVWTMAVALLAVVLAPAAAPPPGDGAPDDPTLGPLISGTSAYVDGTFVWTDYAYDDRGPDTDGQRGGNAGYPDDMEPDNVADLVQLQIGMVGDDQLELTAVLQTLTPEARPLLGVAFSTSPSGGAAALPGSWEPATPLGMERLHVLGVDGGRQLTAVDGAWEETGAFDVVIDPERNTLTATVEQELPEEGALRAVAVVGYEHGGGSWLDGGAAVHDLAFVDDGWTTTPRLEAVARDASGFVTGGSGYWQDGRQASILAGEMPADPAIAEIDPQALRTGRTELPEPEPGTFQTFLYRSELQLGEGVQGSGNDAFYAGPYQPYLVRLPDELRPGLPLVVYLHGASQIHTSPVNTAHHDPDSDDTQHVFDLDAVVVWPLGRGPTEWYVGASERDVLDATDDVLDRLALDRDRVMLAGLSMGGYGTFRLAQLYPDRWSLAYSDVGAHQIGPATVDLFENLTNVALRFQNGVVDPLVNVGFAHQARQLADAAGTVDYRGWMRTTGTHQPAVALAECVYQASLDQPRVDDPARVRYTVDPDLFVRDEQTGLHLAYDGAYWVTGMTPVGEQRGSVDVETHALGWEWVPGATRTEPHNNIVAGRDFCGPNPEVRTGETWDEQARVVTREPRPEQPLITGTLLGLEAVTIDVDRAGLVGAGTATLQLATDETVTLTLSGLAPGTAVSAGGATDRVGGDGTATLSLPPGDVLVMIQEPGRSR